MCAVQDFVGKLRQHEVSNTKKNQTVAHMLPHTIGLIPTTVNLADVLGLRYHTYSDRKIQETHGVFTTDNE